MTEDGEDGSKGAPGPEQGSRDPDAPLSDLATSIGERRDEDQSDSFDELFSEQAFDELDDDAVWERDGEETSSEFGAVGEVIEEGEQTYVVSKRNFCERCQHLSEPPDIACMHEGTEIREFVDMDNVRVHACPVVEERGLDVETR